MNVLSVFTRRSRDFKKVFLGSEEGRRVLAEIYKMCGMNRQIYSPGDTEFNAGKHRVGQGIQSILSQTEADIFELMKALNPQGQLANKLDDSHDPFQQKKGE